MFFEVPGLNLGAPKTETKKFDSGSVKASSNKTSTGSNTKADVSGRKALASDKQKIRTDQEKGTDSAKMSPKQASHLAKPVKIASHPSAKIEKDSGKSKLQQKMEKQLCGARFRYLNQKLYQSHSHEALNHFKDHPEDFDKYHEGFRSQVVHWPVNPVDLFIEQLEKDVKLKQQKLVTVDMGCGEAKILRHFLDSEFKNRIKVHSFDLAKSHSEVVICDMTKVPLPDSSVDVVIFCLSLMSTNFIEAIREARRILKPKVGVLRVAEVESRFENGPNRFISAVEEIGFTKRSLDTQHKDKIKDSLRHPLRSVYNMANCLPPFPYYLKSLNSSAEVQIDLSKPLKLYLRSTELVFKQAAIYYGEGDLERSFILFMKFSKYFVKYLLLLIQIVSLVLDKLPKHPEYGRNEFSTQKSKLKELCRKAISKLETLRPRLEYSYNEALELEKVTNAEKERKQNEELAMKEDVERLKKLKSEHSSIEPKINRSLDSISLNNDAGYSAPVYSLPSALNSIPTLNYAEKDVNSTLKSMQERMGIISNHNQSPHISNETSINIVSKKHYSENGEMLRPVHVPQCLISKFLELAARNTENNLETCGVLAGKLNHDEFTITCLIIPKQVATSDTCAMISEEEIITAQDSLDVMSLGWIHTHPTQRCFLSSVDLHTHMPFQLLMAEAIAIVCAPTQSPKYRNIYFDIIQKFLCSFGIFRLTDPPGLEIITNCQHPSAFHPHPENVAIYRELKGPDSHAQLDHNLLLDVIDLRK